MPYFKVLLDAQNFLISLNEKEELMGFFTTKWVEAANEEEAELKAVDLIKNDKELVDIVLNKERGLEIVPMIYLEEINEISKSEMEDIQGRTWYKMKE